MKIIRISPLLLVLAACSMGVDSKFGSKDGMELPPNDMEG